MPALVTCWSGHAQEPYAVTAVAVWQPVCVGVHAVIGFFFPYVSACAKALFIFHLRCYLAKCQDAVHFTRRFLQVW